MNIENLRDYCLSLPFSEEKFPFDDETLVFCVGGKIFALVDLGNATRVNLKCEPEQAIMLREAYEGIIPGWHMNKKHWITVYLDGSLKIALVKELILNSYDLVKLQIKKTKKQT